MRDKTIAKITLKDLRRYAELDDYNWETEVAPRLDEVIEYVGLNMDIKVACSLALTKVLGTSKKRKEDVRKYG